MILAGLFTFLRLPSTHASKSQQKGRDSFALSLRREEEGEGGGGGGGRFDSSMQAILEEKGRVQGPQIYLHTNLPINLILSNIMSIIM